MSGNVNAIRASLERGLSDLEGLVSDAPDRMSGMSISTEPAGTQTKTAARAKKTAAGQNADTDLRGSQAQTWVDAGDYGTAAEVVERQREERARKPEADSDMLGNPTESVNEGYDDKKYVFARERSALETIAHLLPPETVAKLRRTAMGGEEMSEPLGGPPPELQGGGGNDPAAPGDEGAEPSPEGDGMLAPTSDPVQNVQEVIRQKQQEKAKVDAQAAALDDVIKQLEDAVPEIQNGPEMKAAKRPRTPAPKAAVQKPRVAVDKTKDIVPGGGAMKAEQFSSRDAGGYDPKYKGASDADDANVKQMREANDKPSDDEESLADPDHVTPHNAGDYQRSASRRLGGRPQVSAPKKSTAANGIDWSGYDRVLGATEKTAADPRLPRKTAADDELQPQKPLNEHGTQDAADMGDTATDEIDDGTTPKLESSETATAVGEANRELDRRHSEATKGSSVAKVALFSEAEVDGLKKECKRVDDTYDALHARAVQARKALARGEDLVQFLKPRLATLKHDGEAIATAIRAEGVVAKNLDAVRAKVKEVVVAARREVKLAARDLAFVEAALVEHDRLVEREGRVGPAFALAVHQVKAGLMAVDELPAKVAEYSAMDKRTFETVAKTVQEVGNRARARMPGQQNGKTASKLPSMPEEENLFKGIDELESVWG